MTISVSTNVASLTVQSNLARSQFRLNKSLERLSTGLKINSASDSPAGLVSSELQRAQISGITKSISNIERGVSLIQTADSGLGEINDLLLKLRDLAVDSANTATQSSASLTANQSEADALSASITRVSDSTKFGTKALLDGSFSSAQFQIGSVSGDNASLTIADADATTIGISTISLTSSSAANNAVTAIDAAISTVATARASLGAFQEGTLSAKRSNNLSHLNNLKAAESTLRDTDYQTEIANFTSEQIRQQAATTVLGLTNRTAQSILSLLQN